MVTANVEDLGNEFQDIVSERDFTSFGLIGLAGAGGGVITTQIVNRVAPMVGLSPSPSAPRELFGIGLLKMLIGAGMVFAGTKVGGSAGPLLAVGGLGTIVLGGGDWVNIALTAGGSTGSAPVQRARTNGASGNATARVVSNGSSSSTTSSGGTTANQTSDTTANLDSLMDDPAVSA